MRKVGTRYLPAIVSAAASRPHLSPVSRQLRRAIFAFWSVDLTYLDGAMASGGETAGKSTIFARLSPAKWGNLSSDLEDMLLFAPGDQSPML